ncbi:MAG: hypothetical protein V3V78_03220 [Candidatus Woesearchaeota archaeon]
MSMKMLLGIGDQDHISDEEIMAKIEEAKKKNECHIEIEDEEGNIIKIDIPELKFDKELMNTKYD